MRTVYKHIIFICIFIFLNACASDNVQISTKELRSQDILEKAEDAQKDIESVEVAFMEEANESREENGESQFDFENNTGFIKYPTEEIMIYQDPDDFLVSTDLTVKETDDFIINSFKLKYDEVYAYHQNPGKFFKAYDDDLYEKFDVNEEDDSFTLDYNGDDDDQEKMGLKIGGDILQQQDAGIGEDFQQPELDVDGVSLSFTIDKETLLVTTFEIETKFLYEALGPVNDHIKYNYSNHDDVTTIQKPSLEDPPGLSENDDSIWEDEDDVPEQDFFDEDKEQYENEASAYLDALIQATVFQSTDNFVEKAPDIYTDDEKQEMGDMQKSTFKQTYFENTMMNMEGTNVSEEKIEELSDAFMDALATTKYEIIDSEFVSMDEIIVTIEVKGIDDTAIYNETDEELNELIENGEIDQDEAIDKNMDVLISKYNEVSELAEPVTIDVPVMRNGEGYNIIQDDYLMGFVR